MRPPLSDVRFVWYQTVGKISEVDLPLNELFLFSQQGAQADLILTLGLDGDQLAGEWRYAAELFEPATIARIAQHFQALLAGLATRPDAPLAEIDLLTEHERQQNLVERNQTAHVYPEADMCLHHLVEEQVAKSPDALAVLLGEEQLTYHELNARANQLARHLRSLGVGPDSLVGICLERSIEMLVGVLGILKAGGAFVSLDPAYPNKRLSFMIADTGLDLIVSRQALTNRLPAGEHQAILLDADWPEIAAQADHNPTHHTTPDNLIYVIYTSGSTGQPKGVLNTHRGVVNWLAWARRQYPLEIVGTIPVRGSLNFDGTVHSLFGPLLAGQPVLLLPPDTTHESLVTLLLSDTAIGLLKVTPSYLKVLNRVLSPNTRQHKLPYLVSGGEELPVQTLAVWRQHAPETRIFNQYGPTETTICCSVFEVPTATDADIGDPVIIGRPLPNMRIYVLNEQRQPVPLGVVGELYVAGVGVARGYLNRPELTAERFLDDPFNHLFVDPTKSATQPARMYRTGDLARYRPDGTLAFVGRSDDQVQIRGFRVEPGEIESVLLQHPNVSAAAVVVRELVTGPQLEAYWVAEETTSVTSKPDLIYTDLESKLPDYMHPTSYTLLDALPITTTGKLNRQALLAHGETHQNERPRTLPRNATEEQLVQIWEDVLDQPVGVHDDFFEIGGHSLTIIQLSTRISEAFKCEVPVTALFEYPTIESLAALLSSQADLSQWRSLVPMQPVEKTLERPALFCMPDVTGHVLYLHTLGRYIKNDLALFGLQAPGIDGRLTPKDSVESLAAYCVESIKSARPEGPYYLAGHSFGGKVAYETALQLRQQGDLVPFVALFDAAAPQSQLERTIQMDKDRFYQQDDSGMLLELLQAFERLTDVSLHISRTDLEDLTYDLQLEFVRKSLRQIGLLTQVNDEEVLQGMLTVLRVNSNMLYTPADSLDLPMKIFLADNGNRIQTVEPYLDWEQYGDVEIVEVSGNHTSMLKEPHIAKLALQLIKQIRIHEVQHD